MLSENQSASGTPRPAAAFLSSRTAEWLLATCLGVVLVKSATLSGLANVVSSLPWAKGFETLLTFIAPGLDTSAPWIAGAVLAICAFAISAAANPRHGHGWWALDIFVVVFGIFVLGPATAAILMVLATIGGLAAARARGKYWPALFFERFLVWAVMGVFSYLAVFLVVNADKLLV